ncbi:probable G-protein coupled receptor Mth-like 3 [Centruroides sculpturatus]|uniref:probable G-protein coupled receptor Mth-like 3 n=1 Tax=Centruroides sculpturatus TaxID=218467 RepID=UPI000C6EADE7|nr:probable G-protein coupled receptor Mth-like 3 [Centruroides sculpturatus]
MDIIKVTALPEVMNISNKSSIKCSSYAIMAPIVTFSMILSILCVIVTIMVYIIVSESKTLHGKILMSFSGCLGSMYFFVFLDVYLQPFLSLPACVAIGIVTYIMLIATFFWLNIMAYDIWKTICSSTGSANSKHSKKYLRYSVYAWTSTILTCIPLIVVQNTNLVPEAFHPGIGKRNCWFNGFVGARIFMSAPTGVILLSNLVMFVLTIKSLVQINKMTQTFQIRENNIQFKLYFKLFLIMGLVWMTDFFPIMFKNCHLYLVSDFLNCLHGFFLFVIFICKKKIIKQFFEFFKNCGCSPLCRKSSFHLSTQNLQKCQEEKGSFNNFSTDF